MKWLALDLGSSYSKGALLDETGITETIHVATPNNCSADPQKYEIDMNVYFAQIEQLLFRLLSPDVKGMLISTQMHGFVIADEQFNPLTPYISWRDKYGLTIMEEIRSELGDEATRLSGVPLKANLALCALPARIRSGYKLPKTARFCTLGSFVIGRLTGNNICHITNAAPTGLADVIRGKWNELLIEQAGLSFLSFPDIVTGIRPVALWKGANLYADFGDQQVCAFGAGMTPDTDLHVSIGTAGLMGMLTAQWGTGCYENRPWLENGVFLRTVSGLPGGNQLQKINMFIRELAAQLTGEDISERAVWQWLDQLRADPAEEPKHQFSDVLSIFNLAPDRFIINVYDAIAGKYAEAVKRLDLTVKRISFSGGSAEKNLALRRFIEAKCSVVYPGTVHDVMSGMLRIARQADQSKAT